MFYTLAFVLFFLFLITSAYAGWSAAPWVPIKGTDAERILKLAEIKPGQKFYDLGCGDGRLVCSAARSGAEAIGFEISLLPFLAAHIRRLFQKDRHKIRILFRDFWSADLSGADFVYFFLTPRIYPKLKVKLEQELKKGAKVIAFVWPIEGWQPIKVDIQKGRLAVYLYDTYNT